MRHPLLLCLAICLLLVSDAKAGEVKNLNSARVAVGDRSDAEYRRGIAKALEVVLVKLTGDSRASRSKAGRGVVGQAKRLVQQFGYERPRDSDSNSRELILRVEFDGRVLQTEMRNRGLVVWGKERPDTLLWLIVEDSEGRRLLGANDDNEVARAILRRAEVRGIPVVFPLGDISETGAIFSASSMAEFEAVLRPSAERYGVGANLIGYLRQPIPGVWENEWRLIVGGDAVGWDQQGDFAELLVEEAADTMADILGRRYAAPALLGHTDKVTVKVTGLRSPQDYARTERYLRTLDSVVELFVQRVDMSGIIFDLTVQGGLSTLTQGVSFGRVLAPINGKSTEFQLLPP